MALHVVLEADVVVEALPTVLALEGFRPCVDAHVGLEVPWLVEGAVAQLTGVGFQAGMHHLVSLQLTGLEEALTTDLADVSTPSPVCLSVSVLRLGRSVNRWGQSGQSNFSSSSRWVFSCSSLFYFNLKGLRQKRQGKTYFSLWIFLV